MASAPRRHVALLIESSRYYGRGLLRGIARYVQTDGRWSLRHQELASDAQPPRWLRNWRGDGVIARIETDAMARALQRLRLPTVDLRCRRKIRGVPWIETDDRRVVELAVEHLWERGFRRFAFCGFSGTNYSLRRLHFLRETLAARQLEPAVYESSGPSRTTTADVELDGMLDEAGVTRWLNSLAKPVGLLASNDIRAQQLLIACQQAGIAVPDEVAILGVDNDDVICPLCDPPLSSVEPDTDRIGYEAAACLERMMDGQPAPEETIFVPPRCVVARRSTDVVAIDDRAAAAAYRYIRENACAGISVNDVVKSVGLSRRVLERRLQQHFGRTPHELIAAARQRRLEELLAETDLPLERIARLTGFNHVEHLCVFFKQRTGLPPGQFRTRQRRAEP